MPKPGDEIEIVADETIPPSTIIMLGEPVYRYTGPTSDKDGVYIHRTIDLLEMARQGKIAIVTELK